MPVCAGCAATCALCFITSTVGIDTQVLIFALEAIMLAAYMSIVSSELNAVRTELKNKTNTTISLDDIKKLANRYKNEFSLTDRECEIIQLLMSGRSVQAIADELYLSKSTVKTHISSVYKKLGVCKRQEMVSYIGKNLP